jgi:hypothetical protein
MRASGRILRRVGTRALAIPGRHARISDFIVDAAAAAIEPIRCRRKTRRPTLKVSLMEGDNR